MIVFDLRCGEGHVFEAWFGSSEAFADQRGRNLVACPICGDLQVEKAVMAPAVSAKSNSGGDRHRKAELARLAAMQAEVEQNCDYVGRSFAREARLRHAAQQEKLRHAAQQEKLRHAAQQEKLRHAAQQEKLRHAAQREILPVAAGEAGIEALKPAEEPRGIFGEASMAEAMELIEEGISVAPLPFRSRRSADA